MKIYETFITLLVIASVQSLPHPNVIRNYTYQEFPFMSKTDWGAREPIAVIPLAPPVPFVIIHHTYIPGACYSTEKCIEAMRSMQDFHQLSNGWDDIGYNFAVGGDGVVYEGRGWNRVGAHAFGYNFVSIGIALIGDWVSNVPPTHQLEVVKKLISKGVELGYINQDYGLVGHRQVGATECPGEALYQEIMTWDRFQNISM